jgi:hypothetical protein
MSMDEAVGVTLLCDVANARKSEVVGDEQSLSCTAMSSTRLRVSEANTDRRQS